MIILAAQVSNLAPKDSRNLLCQQIPWHQGQTWWLYVKEALSILKQILFEVSRVELKQSFATSSKRSENSMNDYVPGV